MKHRQFINQIDRPAITAAIGAAEERTSGEIRVLVHHQPVEDPVAFAEAEFIRLEMEKTKDRNAVLIFVAPVSQKFSVVGDKGVHEKCGDGFWQELATSMSEHFKRGEFTAGLLQGIARAGMLLGEHFPRDPDDRNELSNEVIEQ
jgi:uncharacterized membrane protein